MSHDGQDRKLAMTRSNVGSMKFEEVRRFIGVDADPDPMQDESGTATNPEGGVRSRSRSRS